MGKASLNFIYIHSIHCVYNIFFVYLRMRKNIDIEENVLTKLKILAAFEDMSVKSLMEKAILFFVEYKEKERLNSLSDEEREDLGLLLLMQQVDRAETVSESEIMDALKEIK